MKRALVLSGGGSLGAFEVGAVEYLVLQEKLDFQIYLGTSVGALNVSILGQAANYPDLCAMTDKLKSLWLAIKDYHAIYQKTGLGFLPLLTQNYLYRPTGLESLLAQNIDLNRLAQNNGRVVKVVTVALETGELLYADSRRPDLSADFRRYVLASASMPVYFPPVAINGKHWYDGGLRDVTPLGTIFDERPDEIVVVTTYPLTPDFDPVFSQVAYSTSVLQVLLRTVDVLTGEIGANDIQTAALINQNIAAFPEKRRVPIRIIAPQAPFADTDVLEFNPQMIRERMQQGYAAASQVRFL